MKRRKNSTRECREKFEFAEEVSWKIRQKRREKGYVHWGSVVKDLNPPRGCREKIWTLSRERRGKIWPPLRERRDKWDPRWGCQKFVTYYAGRVVNSTPLREGGDLSPAVGGHLVYSAQKMSKVSVMFGISNFKILLSKFQSPVKRRQLITFLRVLAPLPYVTPKRKNHRHT